MPFDHLWAAWRSAYVGQVIESREGTSAAGDQGAASSLFADLLAQTGDDRDLGIVHRGESCFVLLNRFPYTAGSSMVIPNRVVADLEDLDDTEHAELWSMVRTTVAATKAGLGPDACNVGANLGQAAGGSLSSHLHVHVVPRWLGDANFMTTVGDVRTLPIGLDEAWDRLRAAWPDAG